MARRGRPVAELVLTDDERDTLQRWARRAKSSQALAQRCRIVLGCAAGKSNKEVAAELGVSQHMVGKWRQRFVADRLGGLADEPRPGAPRTIGDEQIERVVVSTLERQPADATHWSRASMAKESGLSKSTVGRIWKAFGLKPHLVDTFKISTDPQFIDKVRDVVGLYLDPPEKALVLCVDEKSQIQALDRSAPVLPMMPGLPERRTHDYLRHGITSLFAALDVATGQVYGSIHRRHRATEFKKFLTKLDGQIPAELDVHLICDNYATHKTPVIAKWLDAHPRFHMHHTPTYASWLNQVERWFALLTDKKLRRGAHRSIQALEKDIRDWIATWNENPKPFTWTKTADEILERLHTYLQRIPGAGHEDISKKCACAPLLTRRQPVRNVRHRDGHLRVVGDGEGADRVQARIVLRALGAGLGSLHRFRRPFRDPAVVVGRGVTMQGDAGATAMNRRAGSRWLRQQFAGGGVADATLQIQHQTCPRRRRCLPQQRRQVRR
jgi:transposase